MYRDSTTIASFTAGRESAARITDPAHDRFRDGYFVYFQDLDGRLWEIAWNPAWDVNK